MKDGVKWSKGHSISMKHAKPGDIHKEQGKMSKSGSLSWKQQGDEDMSVQAHTQQGQGDRKAALPKLTGFNIAASQLSPGRTTTANRGEFWAWAQGDHITWGTGGKGEKI